MTRDDGGRILVPPTTAEIHIPEMELVESRLALPEMVPLKSLFDDLAEGFEALAAGDTESIPEAARRLAEALRAVGDAFAHVQVQRDRETP